MARALWHGGVVVVGCRENTAEFVDALLRHGDPIAGIVTISRSTADRNQVPSWVDLSAEFGSERPVYVARSYSLVHPMDIEALSVVWADVGFCLGWQRLLPPWFLGRHRNGVFGMHACANRLPNGRGRSPITWSVIEGAKQLHAHIFRYSDAPDAGDLLSVTEMSIEHHDDIQTLQQKARVIFAREAIRHWNDLVVGTPLLQPLNETAEQERFYPKRSDDDGEIDWSWPAERITNWVRAQTRPYPGAFTIVDGLRYRVWRCGLAGLEQAAPPGTVLEAFRDGTCLVACGAHEGVHILTHDLPHPLTVGRTLGA